MLQIVINFEEFQLVYNALLIFQFIKNQVWQKLDGLHPVSHQSPIFYGLVDHRKPIVLYVKNKKNMLFKTIFY